MGLQSTFQRILALAAGLAPTVSGLAFDGAVGFGAIATGGAGGTTVHVTNLNDSGDGSFRDAVSHSNRIIVFDVGGYIQLSSAVSLSSSLTIQGQTAPGGGIGLMGGELSASGKSNIIIQHLRIRQGTLDSDTGKSAFNMGKGTNIILDHCSFTYGQWDSIDAVGTVNLTVSNSIIAFPIGQQFGAHVETGPSTFYNNLWVSAHNRQPLSKDNTQYINNVIYNYQAAYTAANTGGTFSHDIINNYFISGPSTTSTKNLYYQMNAGQSVYAAGNFLDSNNDGVLNGVANNAVGSSTVLSSPWHSTSLGLATRTAADAYTYVLANAGAQPRDEVDAFAVTTVQSLGTKGTLYKSQSSTGLSNGGYGSL
ncbi:polysaccharide lyase family 1 protein [Thozetella sp. PMI_491]|nr:polysaccharide lyase family 1 protein [Thozetella sp. PMI_491]